MEETINKEEVETKDKPKLSKYIGKMMFTPKRKLTSEVTGVPRNKRHKERNPESHNFGQKHYFHGKHHDPKTKRTIALNNLKNCLLTNARGYVHVGATDKFMVRLKVSDKRYTIGQFTTPFMAHYVYVHKVVERIHQLEKEIEYLSQYSIEQLRSLGALPLKKPKGAKELNDQIDTMFTNGVVLRSWT
jgi:hypothetical protein